LEADPLNEIDPGPSDYAFRRSRISMRSVRECRSAQRHCCTSLLRPNPAHQMVPNWACLICLLFVASAEVCLKLRPSLGPEAFLLPFAAACSLYWLCFCCSRCLMAIRTIDFDRRRLLDEDSGAVHHISLTALHREDTPSSPSLTGASPASSSTFSSTATATTTSSAAAAPGLIASRSRAAAWALAAASAYSASTTAANAANCQRPGGTGPGQSGTQNPLIAERIQQLSERTRICSRRVWEESYLPELRGADGAEKMRSSLSQCTICMSSIAMADQVRGLACGHIFHLPCLAEWFMRDRTFGLSCPICRAPLAEQERFRDWDEQQKS